jgi:hypothetical protein
LESVDENPGDNNGDTEEQAGWKGSSDQIEGPPEVQRKSLPEEELKKLAAHPAQQRTTNQAKSRWH